MATVERRRQSRRDGTPGAVRYRVRWRDPDGSPKSRTFVRRRDADAFAVEVEHRKLTGSYIDHRAGRITLREYAEQWRSIQAWAPSTVARVESVLKRHLYPVLGGRPLGSLRRSDVQAWVSGLDLAPTTVAVVAAHLSSILRAAASDRLIASSPYERIVLPTIPRHEVVPPTPEEVERLRSAMAPRWRAAVTAGAGLGLRASECLGLTVDRVDWLRRTVRVDRQVARLAGEVQLVDRLKTRASARTVPLAPSVGDALAAHLAEWPAGDDGLIFHSPSGAPLPHQRLDDAVRAAVRRAGLHPVRFHDLRHFYASMLIEAGLSVRTVQARLGHASAAETLDTYSHLWPDSEERTRDAVEQVLGGLTRVLPAT